MSYLQIFEWNISKPAFSCHSKRIFLILSTSMQQQRTIYIVTDCISKSDWNIRKYLPSAIFSRIRPGFRQIPGKKCSGSRTDIILPSYEDCQPLPLLLIVAILVSSSV